MHLAQSTFSIILAFISTAAAECYKTGRNGGYNEFTQTPVDLRIVCATLAGNYVKDEFRRLCIMDLTGGKWDFELRYVGEGNRNVDHTECYNGMKAEAGCEMGGRMKYANWEYSADPNIGKCVDMPPYDFSKPFDIKREEVKDDRPVRPPGFHGDPRLVNPTGAQGDVDENKRPARPTIAPRDKNNNGRMGPGRPAGIREPTAW